MKVTKKFHFYAAHRNEEIGGKCANIHGHRYGIEVTIEAGMTGSVSMLFEDFENLAAPIFARFDHALILHSGDPARAALLASGACGKVVELPAPSSAENVAAYLFLALRDAGLNVVRLVLHETDSSSVTVE